MIEGITKQYHKNEFGAHALIIEHRTGDELWRFRDGHGLELNYDVSAFETIERFMFNVPYILYQRNIITKKESDDYYEKTKRLL